MAKILWESDGPDRTGVILRNDLEIADITRQAGTNGSVYTVTDVHGGICYVGNSETEAVAAAVAGSA
jgi:hypothetical protein